MLNVDRAQGERWDRFGGVHVGQPDLVQGAVGVPHHQGIGIQRLQNPQHIGQLAARQPVADDDTVADITGAEA
ncbi:hypothetical protein GCM10009744_16130 [Kribbella alba]|uniref:Uncharacterized protein n=1 Tax=Kribbella alba TaxID=190197 RepID=A0ABN2F3F3_9ACTN